MGRVVMQSSNNVNNASNSLMKSTQSTMLIYICVSVSVWTKSAKNVRLSISIIRNRINVADTNQLFGHFQTIFRWCWFKKLRLFFCKIKAVFSGLTNCFNSLHLSSHYLTLSLPFSLITVKTDTDTGSIY